MVANNFSQKRSLAKGDRKKRERRLKTNVSKLNWHCIVRSNKNGQLWVLETCVCQANLDCMENY